MSRGFWAVIGGIAGFFAGGAAGLGLAAARFDCCYGESGYPVFGEIIGIVIGAWLAWAIAGRQVTPE